MMRSDSRAELLERIRLGEDSFFEMKEVRFSGSKIIGPRRDELSDELAAFANAKGGVCILGVDDRTREFRGIPLENIDAVETYVREIAHDSIHPPLPVTTEKIALSSASDEEVILLRIGVDHSLFVHKSAGGYFHRVGSSRREMSTDYLVRLSQQRSQSRIIRFDEQIVPGATVQDLENALWQRFRTERTEDDDHSFLAKLGMVAPDPTGEIRPTVAGVLLATTDPRRWMPHAFIQAVAYHGDEIVPGPDRPYQLDALDCSGPLDQQISDACRFVFRNMKTAAFKSMGRRDVPQYDMEAVFEAITNAVAHRDYAVYASKVRLQMFSNRLEIYSPGSLTNTMNVESIAYRQASRNETITSLLARCPVPDVEWLATSRKTMMDRRGEGVRIILQRSEKLSRRRPLYELFDDAELRLTIYSADPTQGGGDA